MKVNGTTGRVLAVLAIASSLTAWEVVRLAKQRTVEKVAAKLLPVVSHGIECFGGKPEIVRTSRTPSLVDITSGSGLDFQHVVGPLGTYFMPESVGTGGAFFDYDGDGRLDVFLVQAGRSPDASGDLPEGASLESRLFHQSENGHFEDRTEGSGLAGAGYGVGCAVGDVDNDGDPDLYVTRYAQDSLYLNNADGTFTDVTDSCGIQEQDWGTCAAFLDYNRDGLLDLFVVNYTADPTYGHSVACGFREGLVSYCGPHKFQPTVDRLYRNDGVQEGPDGRISVKYTDVTADAGVSEVVTFGFGVVCADFTGDGWADIFVANDGAPNRLWVNQQNGKFFEEAIQRGCAVNLEGGSEAGMGVAMGDVNHDGRFDLIVTHLSGEKATLYLATDVGYFEDVSTSMGTAKPTRTHTGWGVGLIDLNLDGELDLPMVNGLVIPCHSRFPAHGEDKFQIRHDKIPDANAFWRDYADQNVLLMGRSEGKFEDATSQGGDFCAAVGSGRSLIHGDLDNDGDIDLLITNCGMRAKLYRNDIPQMGKWLSIRVVDPRWKRDAYLAEVTVRTKQRLYFGSVNPGSSYLSSNDSRVHFGLGSSETYDEISVKWPDGPIDTAMEVFEGGTTNRSITLYRGGGRIDRDKP